MDQLNMSNIKHHDKINTHTQRTKNNTAERLLFFSKRQYVRPCKLSRPCLNVSSKYFLSSEDCYLKKAIYLCTYYTSEYYF